MTKQKALLLALSLTVASAGLAACGSNNNNAASGGGNTVANAAAGHAENGGNNAAAETEKEAEPAGPAKPEELTIWADDKAQLPVIQGFAEKYAEKTGIKVNVTPMAMNDQPDALALDGPAGKGPDLFYQPGIGNLVVKGLVQPIKAEQPVLDTFTPESLKALSQDGQLYGLPAVTETYALFYNKKLLPEPPKTIADLEKIAAEKTNAKKQEYGFLFEATNFYFAWAFLGGSGGYIFKPNDAGGYDIHDNGLNKEGTVKGAKLIQSWFDKGYLPKGVNSDIVGGLFGQGKAAAVISGPWAVLDFKKQLGEDFGVTAIPTLEGDVHPTSFIGVKGWMLSKFSENPEWASDLAAFITNEENALEYFKQTGEVPPVKSVLNNELLTNDPIVAGFSQQIQFGMPFPTVPELDHVWDPMANALKLISEGGDAQKSLDDAVVQIEDKMKMAGAK